MANSETVRRRCLDRCALVGSALLLVVLFGGAFLITETHHISPLWVFLVIMSVGFFAMVGWDYRKEFRSLRFVVFFCAWLSLHFAVFLLVLKYLGLLYYPVLAFFELFLFYASAYWLFGLQPPLRRQRP